jgi:hypothetical protein
MDAFNSAFDTIIVGALALPWVLLVYHLFFPERTDDPPKKETRKSDPHREKTITVRLLLSETKNHPVETLANQAQPQVKTIPPLAESTPDTGTSLDRRIRKMKTWVEDKNQTAVAGVLLFAMAYSLGSAVSRIAQDFFDDNDLNFQFQQHLFQVGVTESSIRTEVYCQTLHQDDKTSPPEAAEPAKPPSTEAPKPSDPILAERKKFQDNDPQCDYTGRWIIPLQSSDTQGSKRQVIDHDWIERQEVRATDIFRVHEAALLLKGTDPNERLRQYHDQIMVLRGASFDGLIAFSLCLFWWSATSDSARQVLGVNLMRALARVLGFAFVVLYFALGLTATVNHLHEHLHSPPFMEFTLLLLAVAGGYLLCKILWRKDARHQPPVKIPGAYLVLAALLTVSAFLGWWATQVLYDQHVIYSFKAQSDAPAEAATPSPK